MPPRKVLLLDESNPKEVKIFGYNIPAFKSSSRAHWTPEQKAIINQAYPTFQSHLEKSPTTIGKRSQTTPSSMSGFDVSFLYAGLGFPQLKDNLMGVKNKDGDLVLELLDVKIRRQFCDLYKVRNVAAAAAVGGAPEAEKGSTVTATTSVAATVTDNPPTPASQMGLSSDTRTFSAGLDNARLSSPRPRPRLQQRRSSDTGTCVAGPEIVTVPPRYSSSIYPLVPTMTEYFDSLTQPQQGSLLSYGRPTTSYERSTASHSLPQTAHGLPAIPQSHHP